MRYTKLTLIFPCRIKTVAFREIPQDSYPLTLLLRFHLALKEAPVENVRQTRRKHVSLYGFNIFEWSAGTTAIYLR